LLFIPYYPMWALIIIAIDVAVIWALATDPGPAGLTVPTFPTNVAPEPGTGQFGTRPPQHL